MECKFIRCPKCGSYNINIIYETECVNIECWNEDCGYWEDVYLDTILDKLFPDWFKE